MTVGERIKYLREKADLTQKQVAVILKVEPAAVSKYELDMREPKIESLKKLGELFNVSIDYLLGRTPDVLYNKSITEEFDTSILKDLYKAKKMKYKEAKAIYETDDVIAVTTNELMCGVGKNSYGTVHLNKYLSFDEIEKLLNDFENYKMPKPQILIEVNNKPNDIMIVEIDSYDDEYTLPYTAEDRLHLYMAKLSKEYNVFGLAIQVDKDENCRLIDSVYSKKSENSYTYLELPKTVLTLGEYLDVMSRI